MNFFTKKNIVGMNREEKAANKCPASITWEKKIKYKILNITGIL